MPPLLVQSERAKERESAELEAKIRRDENQKKIWIQAQQGRAQIRTGVAGIVALRIKIRSDNHYTTQPVPVYSEPS